MLNYILKHFFREYAHEISDENMTCEPVMNKELEELTHVDLNSWLI